MKATKLSTIPILLLHILKKRLRESLGIFPPDGGLTRWRFFIGSISGPTTLVQTPLPMPRAGIWNYVNVITRTVASGASAIIDINKNGTSIFAAGTRPTIVGAGTFVSTASIATKNFDRGDRISWDADTGAGLGLSITDFDIILRSE